MKDFLSRSKNIRRKVLVVDDSEVNRRLLGVIVSRNYDVLYAANGREALDILQSQPGTISLVLLDLVMPVMDGYTFMEQFLGHAVQYGKAPVIVLTANKEAEVEALHRGAVDFIPKPYDFPEVILARIERSITLEEDSTIIRRNERDPLTMLYSRNFFMEYVRQHDLYNRDTPMDAAVLTLTRFHMIQDIYGRAFIRQVLKVISEEIKHFLPLEQGMACRGEFGTFLLYLQHRDDYSTICRNIARSVCEHTGNTRFNIHFGVYENVSKSMDPEQRFEKAALLCNDHKNTYKTGCFYYNNDAHEKEMFNERLIMMLDDALRERQFHVYYQPKYQIQGETPVLHSAEALVRWMHPELGMISPGLFIPLFEENGLVLKLDRYVWTEAARQIRKWHDTFKKKIPVSVNVSRVDIYAPSLEKELLALLSANNLESGDLILEITESAYTADSNQIIETAKRLRSLGFRIEMDDFGTGYSSLNMLTSLPIDALKLDMSFIRKMLNSTRDLQLVRLILDIAKFLNIPAIAEGVEDEKQCQTLRQMGCELIQGYYFSKPVPPEDFENLIKKDIGMPL
ncbi:putative bifunctional diguanylate cyclase/phosphodiesterase [Succinimonas amylolytica]|uniref:putative bifunctional diguanylate cyclase/phosphodiesterase n=1 Tax=Succinimonas amylolytica TaxID=83769 RepID=UPI00036C408E|nr:EAL domain-containing response regulator [Succinimonas amylolytica]